jgi:hypothetical protein
VIARSGGLFFFFVFVFNLTMVVGVQLAGLGRMVVRVGGVAGGDMGVVARRLDIARLVMGGGFTMVLGGFLVVVGRLAVVFVRVVCRSHGNILLGLEAGRLASAARSTIGSGGRRL